MRAGSNSINCYQQRTIDNYVVNAFFPSLGAPTIQLLIDQALRERREAPGSLCDRDSTIKMKRDTGIILEL